MNKRKTGAKALHAQVGDTHAVGVLALRVLLVEDTSGWFAQGLDIDYAASGENEEAAKKAFDDGFCATVHEHLVMHGSIRRILKPAPKEVWDEFYGLPAGLQYSCIQLHDMDKDHELSHALPFDHLQFLKKPEQSPECVAA